MALLSPTHENAVTKVKREGVFVFAWEGGEAAVDDVLGCKRVDDDLLVFEYCRLVIIFDSYFAWFSFASNTMVYNTNISSSTPAFR